MIGRPRPLPMTQALGYFLRESQGFESLIEHASFPPAFGGALAPLLGLKPGPFSMEDYQAFVMGEFPALADQELTLAHATSPDELVRAVYEVAVSLPKSISLQMLVSGDERMHRIAQEANDAVMKMFADYCICRVMRPDGTVEKVRVAGIAYASWFHISSRERAPDEAAEITGGADPQAHFHNLVHRLVLPMGARGLEDLLELRGKDVQIAHQALEAVGA